MDKQTESEKSKYGFTVLKGVIRTQSDNNDWDLWSMHETLEEARASAEALRGMELEYLKRETDKMWTKDVKTGLRYYSIEIWQDNEFGGRDMLESYDITQKDME